MKNDYMGKGMDSYAKGMDPYVKDYQAPESVYSQKFSDATLDYTKRQDQMMGKEASQIRKQDYKGRYSA